MTAPSFNQVTSVGNKAEAASIIAAEPSAAKAGVDRDSMLGQRWRGVDISRVAQASSGLRDSYCLSRLGCMQVHASAITGPAAQAADTAASTAKSFPSTASTIQSQTSKLEHYKVPILAWSAYRRDSAPSVDPVNHVGPELLAIAACTANSTIMPSTRHVETT